MTRHPILCMIALVAAFGLIAVLTLWHTSDCRSPRISIGDVVLLAGCGGRAMNGALLSYLAQLVGNFLLQLGRWWRGECVTCGAPVFEHLPLWQRPWPEQCSECDDGPHV